MKKITMIITGVLIAAVALPFASCSGKKHRGFEDRLGSMIDKVSSSLNLDEEQKKMAAGIKEEILKKNIELREKGKESEKIIEEAFTKQIVSERFNEKEINKILDAKISEMEEMRRFMVAELGKFHAILTPSQRIKLAEILKELGPKRGRAPSERPEKKEAGS